MIAKNAKWFVRKTPWGDWRAFNFDTRQWSDFDTWQRAIDWVTRIGSRA